MSKQKKMAAVLRWVNEVRADYGKPALVRLPRGARTKPKECVLGRGLELSVGTDHALDYAQHPWVRIDLPDFVQKFRRDFDRGRYPSLVGNSEPLELLEEPTDCFVPTNLTSGERAHSETRHVPSTDTGTWGAGQDAPRSPGVRA